MKKEEHNAPVICWWIKHTCEEGPKIARKSN